MEAFQPCFLDGRFRSTQAPERAWLLLPRSHERDERLFACLPGQGGCLSAESTGQRAALGVERLDRVGWRRDCWGGDGRTLRESVIHLGMLSIVALRRGGPRAHLESALRHGGGEGGW